MAEKYLEMDDKDFDKLTNTFLDKHTNNDKDLIQKQKEEEFIQYVLKTERIEEIARMVSGSMITNEAREAASKLLDT